MEQIKKIVRVNYDVKHSQITLRGFKPGNSYDAIVWTKENKEGERTAEITLRNDSGNDYSARQISLWTGKHFTDFFLGDEIIFPNQHEKLMIEKVINGIRVKATFISVPGHLFDGHIHIELTWRSGMKYEDKRKVKAASTKAKQETGCKSWHFSGWGTHSMPTFLYMKQSQFHSLFTCFVNEFTNQIQITC